MMDPEPDAPDMLTPDDVAAMHHVHSSAVRKAIREGRLAAVSIPSPPSKRRPQGGGRALWRIQPQDAAAWQPERHRKTSDPIPEGTITIRPGPKEPGELSPVEAAEHKCVSWQGIFYAIRTGRLPARWAPKAPHLAFPVPRPGLSPHGLWFIQTADLDAWRPNRPRTGGKSKHPQPHGKQEDEVTVSEAAALKDTRPPTILIAIWDGRLPARWVPKGAKTETPITAPYHKGELGRWLIRRADLDAYRPLTADEIRQRGQEASQAKQRSRRKAPPDAV